MSVDIARPDVQMLLDTPRGEGMILSCYADTRSAQEVDAPWQALFDEQGKRLRECLDDNTALLDKFHKDIATVRETLAACQSPGVAIFCAAERDYLVALPAAEPHENLLVLDEEPYLVPLLIAAARRQDYLVIVTNTHEAKLYASHEGACEYLYEIDGFVPREPHSSGEHWGKDQEAIARHREVNILKFLKTLVTEAENLWDDRSFRGILLLGEHEVLEHVRKRLPERMAKHVVLEAPFPRGAGVPEICEDIRSVVASAAAEQDDLLSRQVDQRLREGFALALGPQEVLEALRNGQVATLVLGPDPGTVDYRCTGCRSDFVVPHTSCPYCQAGCEKANLWQEILLLALAHNVPVYPVTAAARIPQDAGVAALLARDLPQWA